MANAGHPHEVAGSHWPLLGTVVDVRVTAHDRADAVRAEQTVCDEIDRLEQVFSVFDPDSMLMRWTVDPTTPTSDEFDELLTIALQWQQRSRGAFNVSTRRLSRLWAQAGEDQRRPSEVELHDVADAIRAAPYAVDAGRLVQVGDCSGIDLNSIAKGFSVDRASAAAWRACRLESLTVGAGGDVVHRGATPLAVGIDDPSTTIDGSPPLVVVDLDDCAIATSGSARRGVSVGGEWISHVLDPRTGQPADRSASVTIRAADAVTADVVATIVSVMEPTEGLEFVQALDSSGDVPGGSITCWIVDREGEIHSSRDG